MTENPELTGQGMLVENLAPLSFIDIMRSCVPWGVVVLNADRQVVFANERGRAFLQAAPIVENSGGMLQLESSKAEAALGTLIDKASSGEAVPESRIGISDREGRIHYVARVLPCRTDQGQQGALLIIADTTPPAHHADRSAVARVFQLSPREADFVELFSEGFTVSEIAGRMGISTNTARVHLRNIFEKTGCSSQIELVRLFAHLP
jgi:DNA-binding CsgD family transcriptional regulator